MSQNSNTRIEEYKEDRQKIVTYLERQLIGPVDGEEETLSDPPDKRYLMGMLFPQMNILEETCDDEEIDDISGQPNIENRPDTVANPDDPLPLATQYMPSSIGVSFVTEKNETVRVKVKGTTYLKCLGDDCEICLSRETENTATQKGKWHRNTLENDEQMLILTPPDTSKTEKQSVLEGRAYLTTKWRHSEEKTIITTALVNSAIKAHADEPVDTSSILFQVSVECFNDSFLPYPKNNFAILTKEEEEENFIYQDLPTFGVGHGCSVNWEQNENTNSTNCISSDFMPTHIIPSVDFSISGHKNALNLTKLSEINEKTEQVKEDLYSFVDSYTEWIETSSNERTFEATMMQVQDRIVSRMRTAASRMEQGLELLFGNDKKSQNARTAFALANKAMLMQMHHSKIALTRRKKTENFEAGSYENTKGTWRPFQLAFILMTLPSLTDTDHPDRDLVDLIWFPTGGGKTEAYLALVAYQIILRRMTFGDKGSGTTVITRYTLRLLTTQQFQRSATLICALEILRRQNEEILGTDIIDIGLWVGGGSTPNTIPDARKLLDRLQEGEKPEVGFQIQLCPWCGTEIQPESHQNLNDWGITCNNNRLQIYCPNEICDFHHRIPVKVVDEEMYDNPPTFLIGTIDKFANLAWDNRAGIFFGNETTIPPPLIIQDELHLVSGPLGTVAAIYEIAFDMLLTKNGTKPKIIASTATIKNATEQVRGIYNRQVFQFPPTGLSYSDSYFVKEDTSSSGRLYVGVMGQAHTSITSNIHTSAALLQAPVDLELCEDSKDAYWTLIAYHNSLRELGKSVTLARDDIPDRINVISELTDNSRDLTREEAVIELTSNVSSDQIPKRLELLGLSRENNSSISYLACTNMISVGVDVPRLSLMLVNGQPKTTSEYIQASSRVGRDPSRRPPGLVVTLYSPAKARDRSHYESFKAYHAGIYREVEPTSVTPWALPARERALHAALVIIVRNLYGLSHNAQAASMTRDFLAQSGLADVIDRIVERCREVDPREASSTKNYLEKLLDQWISQVEENIADDVGRFYYNAATAETGLLERFNQTGINRRGLWPTLNSMRNVDVETEIRKF